jgi:TPP-dependent pyruvate/acetoin dehydrogenase alpha subunit
MREARTLEEAVAKQMPGRGRRQRAVSIRGQEAVRAGTALQLGPNDLVSDTEPSAGMASILGSDPFTLLKAFTSLTKAPSVSRLLPTVANAEERLRMTLGAALALKAQGQQGVVVAYLRKDELNAAAYGRLLKPAAKYELPVIFVVLPRLIARKQGDDVAKIAKIAGKSGVPGIPVDACDAVALYRVTQESLGRTRAGDGPVLVECVSWRVEGRRQNTPPTDPLEHLKSFLLGREISTPAWFDQVERDSRRRLKTKGVASKLS